MGVGHALIVMSGLTALLRFGPAGAMGSALTAFEMSAMIGALWNVALLTFAVLPRVRTVIPRVPDTAARPIFARKGLRMGVGPTEHCRSAPTPIAVVPTRQPTA